MKCPVCKDVTLLMSEKNWIEIDYCPECRWVWLDRWELEKLMSAEKSFYNNNYDNSPNHNQQHSNNNYHNHDHDEHNYHNNNWHHHKKKSFFDGFDIFD